MLVRKLNRITFNFAKQY